MSIELVAATAPPPLGPENFLFFAVSAWQGGQTIFNGSDVRPPPPLAFGLSEKREERILSKKKVVKIFWLGICGTFGLGLKKGRQIFFAAPFPSF
jgi:hypothetical protein